MAMDSRSTNLIRIHFGTFVCKIPEWYGIIIWPVIRQAVRMHSLKPNDTFAPKESFYNSAYLRTTNELYTRGCAKWYLVSTRPSNKRSMLSTSVKSWQSTSLSLTTPYSTTPSLPATPWRYLDKSGATSWIMSPNIKHSFHTATATYTRTTEPFGRH
jgi:hypothetical protein